MKKIIYGGILALFYLLPAAGGAQSLPVYGAKEEKPSVTAPDYIAMTFFKLARQKPDFASWARQTEAYKNAPQFQQPAVQQRIAQEMESDYSLLTLQEPLVVEAPVTLSPYSAANRGFFVKNFRPDTFFPSRHNGRSYAIIPQGIMDSQWLPVPDETIAKAIDAAASNSKDRQLPMLLLLTPHTADSSAPLPLGEEDYWLIAASIRRMMLYTADGRTLLWRSDDADLQRKKTQDLLNLYQ